ncbi:MAG: DUF3500 domain-containing protein, partial [Terriglobales bacterium]
AFLATLAPVDAARAKLPFETEERFNWHFIPKPRAGLALKKMSSAQQKAALHLLEAGLSEKGYSKAETIRALERVLAEIEKDAVLRDPELYYVTIFGEPFDSGTWGWRYEGHHISLNWTLVEGRSIASSPQFLGANPAQVKDGAMKGTRALHAEEDLGRELVKALGDAQRKEAIIGSSAPQDIFTGHSRKAVLKEEKGLAWSAMTKQQQALLLLLVEEHAGAQPKELARARLDRIRKAGMEHVRFAWMGGIEKGDRHYYRVQGPTFLIEYDNTQDDGNHIHSVWRDFNGDWGEDLLAQHYKNSPHQQK